MNSVRGGTQGDLGHPVKLSELQQYLADVQENDALNKQFQTIPSGERAPVTIGKSPAAKKKNRYDSIYPYNHSRVKLNADVGDAGTADDYINACFVENYNAKTYIATQAPLLHTMADFWRMVWEQDCPTVVMLANLMDNGKANCDKYWPDEETDAAYGDIIVTVTTQTTYPSYFKRHIQLRLDDKCRELVHFQFTGWPDMGVPVSCTELLRLRRQVMESHNQSRGPVVLHCSAGVGRTGTYLATDYLLEEIQQSSTVDVMKCINFLRSYRMNLVETEVQYKFIHEALLEATEFETGVSLSYEEFWHHHSQYERNRYHIAREYQVLDVLRWKQRNEHCTEALKKENIDKNRSRDILPRDNMRISLSDMGPLPGSYINALQVQCAEGAFPQLVTQMPLEHTVLDFWRLVEENNVTSIIMLNAPLDDLSYMPTEEHAVLNVAGYFSIENTSILHGDIITTDLIVTNSNSKSKRQVTHFQLETWEEEKDFASERLLVNLVTRVTEETSKREGCVLIHCLNGCERTGLFCAIAQIVCKMDKHSQIDVFNSVKEIRKSRPEFITSLEQYQYLWKMVEKHMAK